MQIQSDSWIGVITVVSLNQLTEHHQEPLKTIHSPTDHLGRREVAQTPYSRIHRWLGILYRSLNSNERWIVMGRLYEIVHEFERVKRDIPAGYERDMALNHLLNVLERDHGVPITQMWQRLDGNSPEVELYREIAASRYMA